MKIQAGDSVSHTFTYADSTFTGLWVAVGPQQITKTADNGGAFAWSGAETAGWSPGLYRVHVFATSGADRYPVETFDLTVAPDPMLQTTATDPRTQAEKDLAAVRAVLSGQAADGVAEYEIAGRSLKKIPIADLLLLEKRLAAEVRQKKGRQIVQTVKVNYY
ncbi:hypothetical protein [Caenispirillum bisanense]|uniref:Uncharacterized protein n=1 Tax=Caenispirillum bisanense TaxID=414052 RepID=A0A286GPM6_9PROT|nr:hypothetical protein [Caenispirillum bisanense]SOD97029.1 hypothetical protein SAMN05421508_106215 [Caenispirillum bisanense]